MNIVAVTACPAGVAHTYMAANAIQKEALARGHSVFIEKQGSLGIEDEITDDQIKNADVVIFAVSVSVENIDRFDGKKILEVSIGDGLKHTKDVMDKAELLAKS